VPTATVRTPLADMVWTPGGPATVTVVVPFASGSNARPQDVLEPAATVKLWPTLIGFETVWPTAAGSSDRRRATVALLLVRVAVNDPPGLTACCDTSMVPSATGMPTST
jgi:hypothetical protein